MEADPELTAMSSISQALEPLQPEARQRVLVWAAARFDIQAIGTIGATRDVTGGTNGATAGGDSGFDDFATLFDAANPRTAPQKAMIGAYWYQVVGGQPSLDGQQVNTALKDLGHGVANITDAFSSLMNQHPRLALQVQKSGKSRQARKKYKLTVEGVRTVERMISGSRSESGDE